MNEEWRDVFGYEGLYQVSNLGRVKSLPEEKRNDGRFVRKGETMKLTPRSKKRKNEYLCVGMGGKLYSVHRVVAEAFLVKNKDKNLVNHKDGDKQNNKVENLEWSTSAENNRHAYITGLNKHRIQDFAIKKLTAEQKQEIINNIQKSCRALAKEFRVSGSLVSKIRRQNGIYSKRLRKI